MLWQNIKYRFLRRHTDTSHRPVIMITGCASGIGLALAEMFYNDPRYRVIITAREKHLPNLKSKFQESDRFLIRAMDVTSESNRNQIVREAEDRFGGIHVLVNNAGISYRAVVEHMTEKDEELQMAVNYFGPMSLIRLVLPSMRKSGRGKIINISSVSGMLAMPTMASYSASKHALEGASEALWYETKPLGISVTLIQPGFIHSNSFKNVYYTEKSNPQNPPDASYQDYYHNMAPFIAKLMDWSKTTPQDVAKLTRKIIQTENPPLWVAATFDAFIFYYLRRILPRKILLSVLFWFLPNSKNWASGYTKRRDFKKPKAG